MLFKKAINKNMISDAPTFPNRTVLELTSQNIQSVKALDNLQIYTTHIYKIKF
jgi:hypothetical protein